MYTAQYSEHKAGELCYIDSFSGLIKAKCLRVYIEEGSGYKTCEVKITGNSGAYHSGDITALHSHWIVPRCKVHIRNMHISISQEFDWILEEDNQNE